MRPWNSEALQRSRKLPAPVTLPFQSFKTATISTKTNSMRQDWKKWSDNLNRFCRLSPAIVLVHQSSCIDRSLFYRSYRYCVQRLTTLRTSFDQARLALSNIFSEKVNHDREDSFLKCLLKQKIASLYDSASDRFQLWIVFLYFSTSTVHEKCLKSDRKYSRRRL